jgi:carbamate kinase
MRLVIALGGNALLRRGEAPTAENQRRHVKSAAGALAPVARGHDLVVSHGNGPQVGLLALQSAAYRPDAAYPLDILDAETEGMIGYLVEQELANALPDSRLFATLLTRIEVDPTDPAFHNPSKPIGPVCDEADARRMTAARGWVMAPEGDRFRRVVASPRPQRILELGVIELLLRQGVVVICAGGGGIPSVRRPDGSLMGVEAVIDKDLASALLARELKADGFLMLTDVAAVYDRWGTSNARPIRRISARDIGTLRFAPGSMRPKVEAAVEFVETTGSFAGIGRLEDAAAILRGEAGTLVTQASEPVAWWE